MNSSAESNPPTPTRERNSPSRVGVVGDGQLARMMAPPAIALGIQLHVLAHSESSAAAQVFSHVSLGDYRDVNQVLDFARGVDVVTFDHEHVPAQVLDALIAESVSVNPRPHALRYAQNKLSMREKMRELGLPNPQWAAVSSVADIEAFGESAGWPVVLKVSEGGYDGKGVRIIDSPAEVDTARDWCDRAASAGTSLLAEEKIPFTRELSAQVARSTTGELASYPVVESQQRNGVCDEVIAPAPVTSATHATRASEIAERIAQELDVTGMLAVELFEIAEDEPRAGVYVNELAMRPHNSGHWSMDGAVTSQFEQHLRAVLGLPLGATDVLGAEGSYVVMKNILGASNADLNAALPAAMSYSRRSKVHVYGKTASPGRKVGHVNVVSHPPDEESSQAHDDARQLRLSNARAEAARVGKIIAEGPARVAETGVEPASSTEGAPPHS